MAITVSELIEALRQFPPDAKIDIEATGYEADGVYLEVGQTNLLEKDYGLNELHFVHTVIKSTAFIDEHPRWIGPGHDPSGNEYP